MTIAEFEKHHAGEDFIIVGCGPSVRPSWSPPKDVVTIGVTDCRRWMTRNPDYLLLTDRPLRFLEPGESTFDSERLRIISKTTPRAVFVPIEGHKDHARDHRYEEWNVLIHREVELHKFRFGEDGQGEASDGERLGYSKTSMFPAALLAEWMGARRIGLIGLDLIDHPNLTWRIPEIDRHFENLWRGMRERGVELVNLSSVSELSSVPKITIEEFLNCTA